MDLRFQQEIIRKERVRGTSWGNQQMKTQGELLVGYYEDRICLCTCNHARGNHKFDFNLKTKKPKNLLGSTKTYYRYRLVRLFLF